jgi:hypothetical protein
MISHDYDAINFEIGDEPFPTFDSLNNEIFITLLEQTMQICIR